MDWIFFNETKEKQTDKADGQLQPSQQDLGQGYGIALG